LSKEIEDELECHDCGSVFTLRYVENDIVQFCPMCGEELNFEEETDLDWIEEEYE
jgi:rRNA maturation endonuclease Nob1